MKTKKIQIAVSINESGDFNCCPINKHIDKSQAFDFADEVMDGDQLIHVLVEAEVPLPFTVEATAVETTQI